jgi:PiT family inorganic phosphate transporter
MVSWRQAALLAAFFVLLGAVLEGAPGLDTIGGLGTADARDLATAMLGAALAIAGLTAAGMPASTSHAVAGALAGIALLRGTLDPTRSGLILAVWLATPLLAGLLALAIGAALRPLVHRRLPSILAQDHLLRIGLLGAGCYGAYALGANNVASIAIAFLPRAGTTLACLLGGIAIALGALTISRRVILTVGQGIARLSSFEAFVAVLAASVTAHLCAQLGAPVSATHAIVGAVFGVGLRQGTQAVHWPRTGRIFLTFLLTPPTAALLAIGLHLLDHLQYVP